MEAFNAYSYGTAGWLALQAAPLIFTPTLIVTILSPDVHQPTSLEGYFARSLGFAFIALATLCLLLTGVFPVSSSSTDPTATTSPADSYAVPTVILTTLYHCTNAFYTYTRYNWTGQFAYVLAAIGSGSMAALGLWCILFAGDKGRISRRTGADKRTSGWPFGNAEADKKRAGKKMR